MIALALVACVSDRAAGAGPYEIAESVTASTVMGAPVTADRKVIRSGAITVEVATPSEAAAELERRIAAANGFVESSSASERGVFLTCRVPADQLETLLDVVAGLGDVTERRIGAVDVTDQYADLETRLRNDVALRDRLRALLDRAVDVEDVLQIEKELTRVQSSIETMQGQLDRLKSEVALSTLNVALTRKVILGPLGYAYFSLQWLVGKLFVIR